MTYTNGSPGGLLADRKWRVRHSAWLLAPILGIGFFSFIGFLYCAVRVQSPKWWKIAAGTGALTAVGWLLMSLFSESEGGGSDAAVGYILALWIGLIIYGFVVNRDYLRWRAGQDESTAWYNQTSGGTGMTKLAPAPAQAPAPQAGVQPPTPSQPTGILGVDNREYFAPQQPAPAPEPVATRPSSPAAVGPVDVNSAPAGDITAAVGLDEATAQRIVAAREQRRGFQGIDDLVASAGLQPHELLKLRGKVTFGEFRSAPPSQADTTPGQAAPPTEPRGGRILDY